MIKDLLTLIGVVTVIIMIGFVIIIIIDAIRELIRKLKIRYKQKHRFDKPPTAKCYCVDCIYHNNKTERCCHFEGWYTADSWFCWYATPRKKEAEQE